GQVAAVGRKIAQPPGLCFGRRGPLASEPNFAVRGRAEIKRIENANWHHERLDLMVTICAPRQDLEQQIQFGRGMNFPTCTRPSGPHTLALLEKRDELGADFSTDV